MHTHPVCEALKVEKTHPHGNTCEDFKNALEWGHITVIEGEPQITGKLPAGAKVGNIITNETYNPDEFILNIVIHYCPFCGQIIRKKE